MSAVMRKNVWQHFQKQGRRTDFCICNYCCTRVTYKRRVCRLWGHIARMHRAVIMEPEVVLSEYEEFDEDFGPAVQGFGDLW